MQVTGNHTYKEWAWELFLGIERNCKAGVGYGTYPDVSQEGLIPDDSMESFFLAETLKYQYLMFSNDSFSLKDYVFNTEAHPFKIQP